ncbi:MAG: HD-GYP domain-containing protein [Spirochaetales bacterium]|nr:HD-GYP domain-containing protein [Spirochaetales bacterium]
MKTSILDGNTHGALKKIPVETLSPGMIFDSPVYFEGSNLLVGAGIPLKETDIRRLNQWGISIVETKGGIAGEDPVQREALDFRREYGPGNKDSSYILYISSIKRLDTVFKDVMEDKEVIQQRLTSITSDLMQCVRENRNQMLQYVLFGEPAANKLVVNAVHTAVISIVIGEKIELLNHYLFKLCIAALLHDIGMLRISEDIASKTDKLTDEEFQAMKLHSILTYNIIVNELHYGQEIGEYALLHHENWDGSGYPKRLTGEKIPLPSRIIACADAYSAMVNERPYRERLSGYLSLKTIIGDNGKRFDPGITKALLSSIGIYPIGSIVRLNNEDIGRVVDINPQAVLRPKIKIVKRYRNQGKKDEEIIDLIKRSDIYITETIEPVHEPFAGS